jgi:hypothetical protein
MPSFNMSLQQEPTEHRSLKAAVRMLKSVLSWHTILNTNVVRTCYFGTCCSVKMPKFVGDDRPTRKSRVANLKGGLLLQQ